MYLNSQQILGSDDLGFHDVEVPEWGGTVRVKVLSGEARETLEKNMRDNPDAQKNIRATWVVGTAVDEKGDPVFTADQIQALSKKSGAALDRVFSKALEVNGVSVGSVEKLEKN